MPTSSSSSSPLKAVGTTETVIVETPRIQRNTTSQHSSRISRPRRCCGSDISSGNGEASVVSSSYRSTGRTFSPTSAYWLLLLILQLLRITPNLHQDHYRSNLFCWSFDNRPSYRSPNNHWGLNVPFPRWIRTKMIGSTATTTIPTTPIERKPPSMASPSSSALSNSNTSDSEAKQNVSKKRPHLVRRGDVSAAASASSTTTSSPESSTKKDNNNNKDQNRRNILLSSVGGLLSSMVPPISNSDNDHIARAAVSSSTLSKLEDTELRRIEVFERNAPSVVFIDTFAEKQDVFSPNTMEIPLGTGSGFVYDKEGHIITNYHVIRNAKFAQIALITPRTAGKGTKKLPGTSAGGRLVTTRGDIKDDADADQDMGPSSLSDVFSSSPSVLSRPSSSSSTTSSSTSSRVSQIDYQRTVFKAKVVGTDPGKDIAVLKIDAPADLLYPIQLGTSQQLRVGQSAMAIGNPFGLDHSLTVGVISGLGREVKSPIGRPISNVIQADCSINPGNSGGVLLDSGGKLIGMNTAIYSPSGASAGIGFAIPVDTVKYIADILIKDGKVVRPILGISFLESKQARALGISKGVLVLEVPEDSPAAKAGLKGTRRTETGLVEIGDIIVKVGKTVIETETDLFTALETYQPGDEVTVVVVRIEAVNDQLTQRELTLNIKLQSSEVLEQGQFLLRGGQ